MFKITLNPVRSELTPPVISAQGDVLTINGEAFDFGQLQEGEILVNRAVYNSYTDDDGVKHTELVEPKAVSSDYITRDVKRSGGYIEFAIHLPYKHGAPRSVRYPNPRILTITTDGPVPIQWTESEAQNDEQ